MKKIVLLVALSLLGSIVMSCDGDNATDNPDGYADEISHGDDGLIPLTPPPPVPPRKP